MNDPVDQIAQEVIRVLDQKMGKGGTKNISYPFGYDLTTQTIRAVAALVVAHYQPRGLTCRLELNPNNVGIRARLRITKAVM
jgi:hypothetical protein